MADEKRTPVTVLGLGLMGSALASALVRAGHPTTVWNRMPGKAGALVAQGAVEAAGVAEAVTASPVVVACLLDHDALHEVLAPAADALAGRLLVNLTSGLPDEARQAAARAARLGTEYLDGTVMTVPPLVGQPRTLLFYSGSRAAFDTHRETLAALGGNGVFLGEDAGAAALHDLALLGVLWSTLAGALHGFALLGSEQVPASALLPFLGPWITQVVLPGIAGAARQVEAGRYGDALSTVALNRAGLAKMVKASEARGVRPDLMVPIHGLLDAAVAAGHGGDGLASLFEVIRTPEGGA
ncbi:NAD(P)-dependent oxidoreductase [Kitasatospora cineracea]|uniref:3-hydroxyisobutyrate dehydrogenase-like beta-hydroxyacid dehydrogenase n=1 Tax=Kitasatospora cineracea TaxID=88074 RepID=A0A3N4RZM2_9ACTN|nr:NAD(P)-binding domain-containing protein [Kitasatospora cineracea]RPE36491.1 3-hydroxyisobutyrate dehydrogenase-like beta-hydroxyacid dehydrogenase [Kitasatospora cineracea]